MPISMPSPNPLFRDVGYSAFETEIVKVNSMPADENSFFSDLSGGISDFFGAVSKTAVSGFEALGSVANAAKANNPSAAMDKSTRNLLLLGGGALVLILLAR